MYSAGSRSQCFRWAMTLCAPLREPTQQFVSQLFGEQHVLQFWNVGGLYGQPVHTIDRICGCFPVLPCGLVDFQMTFNSPTFFCT